VFDDIKGIAFAIPFGCVANTEQMEQGLHLAVTDILRIPPCSVDPTVKNYHWLDMVKGLYAAYEQGADTAVLIDSKGNVSEGPGFNVFMFSDGVVSTPDTSVLLGITRQTVFDICSEMGVQCHARDVSIKDLTTADEVFVTSTAGGVMPVTRIDNEPVGTGGVGSYSKMIMAAYWEAHDDDSFRDAVSYPREPRNLEVT
jgi:branched-chain amino acid aminotransferase